MSCVPVFKGTCRPCTVDVVPVKNEEGVVIMFILDFQELIDRSLAKSGLRQRVAQGWIYCNALTLVFCPRYPGVSLESEHSLSLRSEPEAEDEAAGAAVHEATFALQRPV